jgi:hypothetical protein
MRVGSDVLWGKTLSALDWIKDSAMTRCALAAQRPFGRERLRAAKLDYWGWMSDMIGGFYDPRTEALLPEDVLRTVAGSVLGTAVQTAYKLRGPDSGHELPGYSVFLAQSHGAVDLSLTVTFVRVLYIGHDQVELPILPPRSAHLFVQ